MTNTGFIITLAYPDTIVMVADEWYSPLLRLIGIGKKNYVRAGHAALVLINAQTNTGDLEYHDFGRYITPEPFGRVRGKTTDNELDFPIKAEIANGTISNLDAILKFLATHPKLTHGEGRLVASVAKAINYDKAKAYIENMQEQHFVKYAAFEEKACNCARFVTDALIAGATNSRIKKRLIKSKWFTPSTVGNVLLAQDEQAYEVSERGEISIYKGSQSRENIHCFFDTLKAHTPNFIGSLEPKPVEGLHKKAQWLSGIAAGAWFELYTTDQAEVYRFRRISPYGHIDCDALFTIDASSFNYEQPFEFVHYSNCKFFNILQNGTTYHFTRNRS
jgi:hypothetical protein